MRAVILAAGMGTRLRPITESKPKCLVKAAGKPILQHQIEAYLAAGVEQVLVVTGYSQQVWDAEDSGAAAFALLRKPFTLDQLARAVRHALDGA